MAKATRVTVTTITTMLRMCLTRFRSTQLSLLIQTAMALADNCVAVAIQQTDTDSDGAGVCGNTEWRYRQ
ncbi:MAG: hypothetical protein IPK95_00405 [Cellvibrionales bacterium]|nr:hypothetical protein [Cellvibrionales bacterium]